MKALVAQIGARRHYLVPRALYARRSLEALVTDACVEIAPWRWLERLGPKALRSVPLLRRLSARAVPGLPSGVARGFPVFALTRRWHRAGEAATDHWARVNAQFCRKVVRSGFGNADTVYAFNGAALEIFQTARAQGLRTVLDQTAAPWGWNTELLREERERWPGWEAVPAEIDASGALTEREEREWALADRIVCGSDFVVRALAERSGPAERCRLVPYPLHPGFAATPCGERRLRGSGTRAPLKVLFVGSLQLRKGIQYLLQARRLLDPGAFTFRVVGPSLLSSAVKRTLRDEMQLVGAVPRTEVLKHLAWADVLVLPTLSEGSANVVHEALAAGLPVITTENAGCAHVTCDRVTLVPVRDAQAIARALEECAGSSLCWQEKTSGLAGNESRLSYERYTAQLSDAISA